MLFMMRVYKKLTAAVYIELKCVHEIASFPGLRLFRLHEEHFTFVQSNKPGTWERGYIYMNG